MFDSLNALRPQAHWLLRIAFATVFLFHGAGKVASVSGFAEMMNLSLPVAWLVTFAEVAAGIGLIVGAFGREIITRLAAMAGVPVLIGAIAMVHWPRWSFTPADGFPVGGMEFQVVLLLIALYFLIVGNAAQEAG